MRLIDLHEYIKPFLTRAFVEGRNMTAQEILEGVCRHRGMMPSDLIGEDIRRKINEIEWALQAIAEKLVENEKPS